MSFFTAVLWLVGLYFAALAFKLYPKVVFPIFMLLIVYAAVRNFLFHVRRAPWPSKWRLVRKVRKIRKGFLVSPFASTLYAASIVFAFVGLLLGQFVKQYLPAFFDYLCGMSLCAAVVVDWYFRGKVMFAPKWAKAIGVAVLSFLGAATLVFSNVISNQVITWIAQVNPLEMPDVIRLTSAFLYPFSLTLVVCLALMGIMFVQSVGLLTGTIVVSIYGYIFPFAHRKAKESIGAIAYKVLNGKKLPKDCPWWRYCLEGVQFFLRPVGTAYVAIVVANIGQLIFTGAGHLPVSYLQNTLVIIQYHTPHLCENVDSSSFISYQADGYVSVAKRKGDGFTFTSEKCHK